MKKIILHVGFPKTGTTSIQYFLYKSISSDSLPGMCYHVPFSDMNSQHLLWKLFSKENNFPQWIDFELKRYSGVSNVEDALTSCWEKIVNSDATIISSEYLTNWSLEELVALRKELNGFDVLVIAYVRSPDKYYLAFIQQQLKIGSSVQIPDKFVTPYDYLLKKLSKVFDKIQVRSFESLYQQDLILDFSLAAKNYFNIEPNYDLIQSKRFNESISAEGMIYLQQWHRTREHDGKYERICTRVVKALRKSRDVIPQTKPRLKRSISNIIYRNAEAGIKELRKFDINFVSPFDSDSQYTDNDISTYLQSYSPDILSYLGEFVKENVTEVSY